jgi:hypothetical protein
VNNSQSVDASFEELVVELMSFNKDLYEREQEMAERIGELESEVDEAKLRISEFEEQILNDSEVME